MRSRRCSRRCVWSGAMSVQGHVEIEAQRYGAGRANQEGFRRAQSLAAAELFAVEGGLAFSLQNE